jgi:hypothetical protein
MKHTQTDAGFTARLCIYIIYTKVDSRQSHLKGKCDIGKDVRTDDQLPMVVTTGSSAAVTHAENTEVL